MVTSARQGSRIPVLIHWILVFTPFLSLVFLVLRYKVNVPQLDDWDFIPLIEKSYGGTLTLSALWSQHGAHRQFFPKLILILCARLTGWDVTYLLMLNVAVAMGIFAVLGCQVKKTLRTAGYPGINGLIPVLSLFVFSLHQYENWLWGAQAQTLSCVLAVVAGTVVLAAPGVFRWRKIGVAWVLGVLGTCTHAAGLLFWLLSPWILCTNSFQDARVKRKALFLWMLLGSAVTLLYFYRFLPPSEFRAAGALLRWPSQYLRYVLTYLGTPMAVSGQAGAVAAAGIGLGIFAAMCRLLTRRQLLPFQALVPYLSMGLFSIGSALLTGIGRAGFGSAQAMSSRYVAFGQLLWIADLVFLYLLFRGGGLRGRRFLSGSAGVLFAGIVFLAACNSVAAIRSFRLYHQGLSCVRERILAPSRDEAFYRSISPVKKSSLETGIVILRKRRLSLFSETTGSGHLGTLHSPSSSQ